MDSLKERIKHSQDIRKEILNIEEWDVDVEIRTMSGAGRAKVLSSAIKKDGTMDFEKMYSELLLNCVFEPDTDNRVFDNSDLSWLMTKSSKPIEQIVTKAMELSGLTGEAAAVIEKNSEKTQSGDSTLN